MTPSQYTFTVQNMWTPLHVYVSYIATLQESAFSGPFCSWSPGLTC